MESMISMYYEFFVYPVKSIFRVEIPVAENITAGFILTVFFLLTVAFFFMRYNIKKTKKLAIR